MQWGLNEEDIGIITPYSLQLRALKKAHEKRPQITVGTIDDFQGKFMCFLSRNFNSLEF